MVFLDPPELRVLAITEMKTPTNKKELQSLCGMIASLKPWFPSVTFSTSNLRSWTAHNKKFGWSGQMDLQHIFKSQIRLSPYIKSKKLRLCMDGASIEGVGFVLFQYIDDLRPELR